MNVEQVVIELIAKEAKKQIHEVSPESKIRDIGVDSLSTVHVVLKLEELLKVRVPDDDVGEIKTVQDIIDLCNRLLS